MIITLFILQYNKKLPKNIIYLPKVLSLISAVTIYFFVSINSDQQFTYCHKNPLNRKIVLTSTTLLVLFYIIQHKDEWLHKHEV